LLLLAASTSACEESLVLGDGRGGHSERDSAVEPDASDDASEPDSDVPRFSEPTLIEALAADEDEGDDDPALDEALTWIFFNSTRAGGAGREDLWFSRRQRATDPWATPEPATALNSDARETGSALSEDGLTIYWSSDREGGAGGLDIYTSERTSLDAGWSAPQAVNALNESGDDLISAVLEEGRLALFARRDGDADYSLWWARRDSASEPWSAPEPIDELGSSDGDTDPFLAREGTQLLFSREGDLQIAERTATDAPFGPPSPLSTLNSDSEDTDPWSDRDLTYVVFASDRSGQDRLYEARRDTTREPAP
jgi:hypothetical protein